MKFFKSIILALACVLLWAGTASAQVAIGSCSESHTGTTGSTSEASFTWNHTPTGTPVGVIVFVANLGWTADRVSSVTYDGDAVPAVTGGSQTYAGFYLMKAYFLGASVNTTSPAAIVVNRTNNAEELYAVACTVTAGSSETDTYDAGIVLDGTNSTLAQQSVSDGSPGTNSLRIAAVVSGLADLPDIGADSTSGPSIDIGTDLVALAYETTPGQGSRNIGWTDADADIKAAVYLAITQVGGGAAACTGGLTLLGAGKCDD